MNGSFQIEWKWTEEDGLTFALDVPGGRSIRSMTDMEIITEEQMEKVRDQIKAEHAEGRETR